MYLNRLNQFDVTASTKIRNHFHALQFFVTIFIFVIISSWISPSICLPLDTETPSADSNGGEEPVDADSPTDTSVPREGVLAGIPSEGEGDGDAETRSETSEPKEEGDGDDNTPSEPSVPKGEGDGDDETPSETSEPKEEEDGDAETPLETPVPEKEGDSHAENLSEISETEGEKDGDAGSPSEASPLQQDGEPESPSETSAPQVSGDVETPTETLKPKKRGDDDTSESASNDVSFTKSKKDCKKKKEGESEDLGSSSLSIPSGADTRSFEQLSWILLHVYGISAIKFAYHGNYCGLNLLPKSARGKGLKPTDECDKCCKKHDDCYTKALNKGCFPYLSNFLYEWKGLKVKCSKKNEPCPLQACICDMKIAECLHQVGVVQNLC